MVSHQCADEAGAGSFRRNAARRSIILPPGGDGTFTIATFDIGWRKNLVADLGINVAVRSQLASQPLLISEETGLGGANFVRGYDYSEQTGDQAHATQPADAGNREGIGLIQYPQRPRNVQSAAIGKLVGHVPRSSRAYGFARQHPPPC